MKIIFNEEFYDSSYASNGASVAGRMEAVMAEFGDEARFQILPSPSAEEEDILRAHTQRRYLEVKKDRPLYEMAMLAAGAAVKAAEISYFSNEAVFACLRPPGHHAGIDTGWGYCAFCNVSVALLKLKASGLINNAVVVDFDAHTGDGNIDTLKNWPEAIVINPYADNNLDYIKLLETRMREINNVDIIAVSAGFDAYKYDVGKKLETFDFYQIGRILKSASNRMGHQKRFAVLEGGYYLADLGKNVLAFCEGFMQASGPAIKSK